MKVLSVLLKVLVISAVFGGISFGAMVLADYLNRDQEALLSLKKELHEACQRDCKQGALVIQMNSRNYLGGMSEVYLMRITALDHTSSGLLSSTEDSYSRIASDNVHAIQIWIKGKCSDREASVSEEQLESDIRLSEVKAANQAIIDLENITDKLVRAGREDSKALERDFRKKEEDLRLLILCLT